jgi:hypothetical protein
MTMIDHLGGGDRVRFHYRMPTTAERNAYESEAIQRQGRKVKFKRAEAQLKYGLRILEGFDEGPFVVPVPGKKGKTKPIASDQTSQNYAENWKELIKKHAADLVRLLGAQVFEGSAEIEEDEGAEVETGEDAGK